MPQIQDLIAELACVSFVLTGATNATKVLSLTSSEDFVGYDGLLKAIITAAEQLSRANETITYIGVKQILQKTPARTGESMLDKMGGEAGLIKIIRNFRVKDSLVRIEPEDGDAILASPEIAATAVRDAAAKRALLNTINDVQLKLSNSQISIDSAKTSLQTILTSNDLTVRVAAKSPSDDDAMMRREISIMAGDQRIGIETGMTGYDSLSGGVKGGDYIEIAAGEKQCKSVLGLHFFNYISRTFDLPTAIFSMEMPSRDIRKRWIAMNSDRQLRFERLMSKLRPLTPEEADLATSIWDRISKIPIYIVDSLFDPREIMLEAERLYLTKGVRGFLFDYIQRARSGSKKANREELISDFSVEIANFVLARATDGVFAIVNSQLNDEGANNQRIFGNPSTKYAYGSKQMNKDATVLSALQVDDEQFICGCPSQTKREQKKVGNKMVTIETPLWDKRPTSGFCTECRQRVESINPIRQGKWIIENARNFRGGFMVPFKFDGAYMLIEEITEQAASAKMSKLDDAATFF